MKLEYLKCISENIDLDEYIEFREYVKANMLNPDWLGDFSREDLINMLSQGCTKKSIDLLKMVGVDLEDIQTYKITTQFYKDKIDELKNLW